MRHKLQWAAALAVAGLFSIWTARGWRRIGRALAVLLGILKSHGQKVKPEILTLRLDACRHCPIYYAPLRTCGSPLDKRLRSYGCWCYVEEAAKYHEKICYLDAEVEPGYPGGWEHVTSRGASRHI